MRDTDKEEFNAGLEDLSAMFNVNRELSYRRKNAYFAALKHFPIESIQSAIGYLIERHTGYMPLPAEIRAAIRPALERKTSIRLSEEAKEYIENAKNQKLCPDPKSRWIKLQRMWMQSGAGDVNDDKIAEIMAVTGKMDNGEFSYFCGKCYEAHENQWCCKWPAVEYATKFRDRLKPWPRVAAIKFAALKYYMMQGDKKNQHPYKRTVLLARDIYDQREKEQQAARTHIEERKGAGK